ncbi:MAG: tetratricopeptide repeat protein [Thermodesulfobacteriota bacterium]
MTQATSTTRRERFRRKDLREPDEFITLSRRAVEWGRQNLRLVQIGAGVLLAVLLLVGGIAWYLESRSERAARAYYGANELFKREQWQPALESFGQVASDYSSTSYGKLARLYAGRSAMKAGKPAEALPFLREFADAAPSPALEQLARVELAAALEATGDAAGAREQLARATGLEGPAGPQATVSLARLEEGAGQRDKAIELYRKYLEESPEGASADLARMRLTALGVTPPPAPPSAGFPGGLSMPQIQIQ